jgi:hypothetical protein
MSPRLPHPCCTWAWLSVCSDPCLDPPTPEYPACLTPAAAACLHASMAAINKRLMRAHLIATSSLSAPPHPCCVVPACTCACSDCTDRVCSASWGNLTTDGPRYAALAILINYPDFEPSE